MFTKTQAASHLLTVSILTGIIAASAVAAGLPKRGELDSRLAPFDDAMEQIMLDNDITAGLLGMMRNGEIVLQRSYGWVDAAETESLPPDAIMRVASVSKPITAAAIQRLASAGHLSLDDYVFDLGQPEGGILDIVPFNPPDNEVGDARLAEITVRNLLQHEGGWDRDACVLYDSDTQQYTVVDCEVQGATSVPDLTRREIVIANEMGVTSPPSRHDTARWILGQSVTEDGRGLIVNPGTEYHYSNEGYFLLGMIVEAVSGESYDHFVRESVLSIIFRSGCDFELGRTFAIDQDPREPYYDSDGATSTNVYDPGGPAVESAYGGWNHEARRGQGNVVIGTAPLLHFLDNYRVNGDDIGVFLPGGPDATRRHGGNLNGTNAMARQRSDGINYAIIFNKNGEDAISGDAYATALLDAIDAIIDGGTITWPTGDRELDCNQNGIPDSCDIVDGSSLDLDGNFVPDECERIVNVTRHTLHANIQEAIDLSSPGDEIMVPPGSYDEALFIDDHGVTLRSTSGPDVTVIDRAYAGGSVMTIDVSGTTIDGFRISGGFAERGAGIEVVGANVVIRDCMFDGNIANGGFGTTGGGGLYLEGSTATIESCVFVQNLAGDAQNGGAVLGRSSFPTFTDCSFTANEAGAAGAVALSGGTPGNAVFTDCVFTNNQSNLYSAGAISTYQIGYDLVRCTFAGNSSAGHGGAGFHQNALNNLTRYSDCTFDANAAVDSGGAVWTNSGSSAVIELTDCTFVDNEAGSDGGTSGRNGGAVYLANSAVLTDCVFERNHSTSWAGAGRIQGDSIEIVGCSFIENTAGGDHGALYIGSVGGLIRDCVFRSNSAVNDNGALYAPTTEILRCFFDNNTAGRFAGAVYTYEGGLVDSCIFRGNTGAMGGAIFGNRTANVRNCLLVGNTAERGGGLWTNASADHAVINSTFVGNHATVDGGGIFSSGGEVAVLNTIVWNNTADAGGAGLSETGDFIVAYSDIQGGTRPGEGNVSIDPEFVNAGGGNYRLAANSVLIEAGGNHLVPPDLTLDLDETARIKDADGNGVETVDMGAYEASAGSCADINGDGMVGFADVLAILAAWGNAGGPEDVDGDGTVGFGDVLHVLASWGPCG